MSEFDKEAEREKLREQFERDKQKRQATERMSELLLKGATMTNKHCKQCGDPVFRQDGEEFCPSCGSGAAVQAEAQAEQSPDQTPDQPAQAPEPDSASTPEPETPDVAEAPTDAAPASHQPAPSPEPPQEPSAADEDDLAAARASLARTLTRMAERAERADDPRTATAYLEAAKEAAEALDALR